MMQEIWGLIVIGLESTALSTQTEAEYLGTGAARLGDASGEAL